MTRVRTRGERRSGLSLMEVILAIAILGGSLAVIGELMRLGSRAALEARELTTAQILCESKLSEIVMGIEPMQAVSESPFDLTADSNWLYSIEVQPMDDMGLNAVRVTVGQRTSDVQRPVSYSVTRWLIDPTLQASAQTAASTSTTSTGSTGTGGVQ